MYSPGMHAMLQSLESQSCNHGPQAHTSAGGGARGGDGTWESSHFAVFPPALNYFLAQAIARLGQQHAIHGESGKSGEPVPPTAGLPLPPPGPRAGGA
eukprot:4086984-Prymnesium_polylepis.1